MKKSLMFLAYLLISSPAFAESQGTQDTPVMNIVEISITPDRDRHFDEVARQTITASVDHEAGTLAMYALKRSDKARQAYMVELLQASWPTANIWMPLHTKRLMLKLLI